MPAKPWRGSMQDSCRVSAALRRLERLMAPLGSSAYVVTTPRPKARQRGVKRNYRPIKVNVLGVRSVHLYRTMFDPYFLFSVVHAARTKYQAVTMVACLLAQDFNDLWPCGSM